MCVLRPRRVSKFTIYPVRRAGTTPFQLFVVHLRWRVGVVRVLRDAARISVCVETFFLIIRFLLSSIQQSFVRASASCESERIKLFLYVSFVLIEALGARLLQTRARSSPVVYIHVRISTRVSIQMNRTTYRVFLISTCQRC